MCDVDVGNMTTKKNRTVFWKKRGTSVLFIVLFLPLFSHLFLVSNANKVVWPKWPYLHQEIMTHYFVSLKNVRCAYNYTNETFVFDICYAPLSKTMSYNIFQQHVNVLPFNFKLEKLFLTAIFSCTEFQRVWFIPTHHHHHHHQTKTILNKS